MKHLSANPKPGRPSDDVASPTNDVLTLVRHLSFGGSLEKGEGYRFIDTFSNSRFRIIADQLVSQTTVAGIETRRLQSYVASALVMAIRDFRDTGSGVDAACAGAEIAVSVGRASPELRKNIRRQIRRTLDSSQWNPRNQATDGWFCPFCGAQTRDDGEGWPRFLHLNELHPDVLPARADMGAATGWNRVFVRNHLLGALAGLLQVKSWPTHRRYFVGTPILTALDEHFSKPGAQEFVMEEGCRAIVSNAHEA